MIHPDIKHHPGYAGRLDPAQLQPGQRHYNHAIVIFRGDMICAYRYQDASGLSRIGICYLTGAGDKSHVVRFDRQLVLPINARTHAEDPRLIVINGQLIIMIATVEYAGKYAFVQRAYRLNDDLEVKGEIQLPYGQNGHEGRTEKNWMPFEIRPGQLGFVHSVAPFTVIDHEKMKTGTHVEAALKNWRWGRINGRTPAIPLEDGSWICLVGGHVPYSRRDQIYWVAALTFRVDKEGLYRVGSISSEPILWGSAATPAILNPHDPRWNPICVFPAGLVRQGDSDRLLVSLGVNDSFCDFLALSLKELRAGMISPDDLKADAPIVNAPPGAECGQMIRVRVPKTARGPVGEPGGPYLPGAEFTTTLDRVHALGPLVERVEVAK